MTPTMPERQIFTYLVGLACASFAFQIICGGIRFVDGSVLLAFSQLGFNAPLADFSQFLFDSPLKVLILYLLSFDSAITIGFFFLLTNFAVFLPAFFFKSWRQRLVFVVVVCLLPIPKMLFQTIGTGDGITLALAFTAVLATSLPLVILAVLIGCAWHFQQMLVIALGIALLKMGPGYMRDLKGAKAILIAALAACAAYGAYRLTFNTTYVDRFSWVLNNLDGHIRTASLYFPIWVAGLIPAALLLAVMGVFKHTRKGNVFVFLYAAIVVLAAAFVTDKSRVAIILAAPGTLLLLRPYLLNSDIQNWMSQSKLFVYAIALISAYLPLYFSWTGIDFFVWDELVRDFRKYL